MIFHIAQETDWTAAQSSGAYKASSLAMEGFIHCSDQHQVLEVAHRLFQNRQDLVLLAINPQRLEAELRYENCEGEKSSILMFMAAYLLLQSKRCFPLSRMQQEHLRYPQI